MMIKPDITSMAISNQFDHLYYAAKDLHTFDLIKNEKIQRLPNTKNGSITVSNSGTLLACIHPIGMCVEVIFYRVDGLLMEVKRVRVPAPISAVKSLFSKDDEYVFFCGQDDTIWKIHHASAKAERIFQCKENEVIHSMSVNRQGILICVYGIMGNDPNSSVVFLDLNGKVIQKYAFVSKSHNRIALRDIGCSWISENSFVCMQDILCEGVFRRSLQVISLSCLDPIDMDNEQIPLNFAFLPNGICVSNDYRYMAITGTEWKENNLRYTVTVYALPRFERIYFENYDCLWSASFASASSTLLICSNMQHFIQLS